MRQYPIWIKITSCIYKSEKSFGVRNDGNQKILVGTSKSNSHHFADIRITRKENEDGTKSFALFLDGVMIKQGVLDGSDFKIISHAENKKKLRAVSQ